MQKINHSNKTLKKRSQERIIKERKNEFGNKLNLLYSANKIAMARENKLVV